MTELPHTDGGQPQGIEVTLVSGLSGAGRSTAAKVLEDLGWFVVDNLPPELIATMVKLGAKSQGSVTRIAVVVDVRSRAFTEDLAAVVRGLVTGLSVLTILAVILVVGSFYVLWRTPFGLRLRSCGENPVAAESLGVDVYRYKYLAVIASGALAGLGGVFLAEVASSAYRDGQTGGRGYIGLAAMIFGNWRPGGLVAGSALFGYTDALQLRQGGQSVHALLLVLVVALAAITVWRVVRRRPTGVQRDRREELAGTGVADRRIVLVPLQRLEQRPVPGGHPPDP